MDNVQIHLVHMSFLKIVFIIGIFWKIIIMWIWIDVEFEYFTGIPDIFTKVAGPFSVFGLDTETGGAHFYANIELLEIELEPGQVIGVEGVQIGYK